MVIFLLHDIPLVISENRHLFEQFGGVMGKSNI